MFKSVFRSLFTLQEIAALVQLQFRARYGAGALQYFISRCGCCEAGIPKSHLWMIDQIWSLSDGSTRFLLRCAVGVVAHGGDGWSYNHRLVAGRWVDNSGDTIKMKCGLVIGSNWVQET